MGLLRYLGNGTFTVMGERDELGGRDKPLLSRSDVLVFQSDVFT